MNVNPCCWVAGKDRCPCMASKPDTIVRKLAMAPTNPPPTTNDIKGMLLAQCAGTPKWATLHRWQGMTTTRSNLSAQPLPWSGGTGCKRSQHRAAGWLRRLRGEVTACWHAATQRRAAVGCRFSCCKPPRSAMQLPTSRQQRRSEMACAAHTKRCPRLCGWICLGRNALPRVSFCTPPARNIRRVQVLHKNKTYSMATCPTVADAVVASCS
jgi:hypothetical protein